MITRKFRKTSRIIFRLILGCVVRLFSIRERALIGTDWGEVQVSTIPPQPAAARKPKFLDEMRTFMRARRYSRRTERAYVDWTRRFILFHGKRHPRELGEEQIVEFVSDLAEKRNVSASTQNQAFCALLFLYQQFLEKKLGRLDGALRASKLARLPVVLSRDEVRAVLAHIRPRYRLMVELVYGSGLRLLECLRLRVKDIDFDYGRITIRDGKGMKDRVTMLPGRVGRPLKGHLAHAKAVHERDLQLRFGSVYLPEALHRKYPNAHRSWMWQYIFPAAKRSVDPVSGRVQRHHPGGVGIGGLEQRAFEHFETGGEAAEQIAGRHQIRQEINLGRMFVHERGSRAMMVDPAETWSPTFTRTEAVSGKYTSVREPKRIIPKRSPFFNSSPTFAHATMRRAIAPVSWRTTIVTREFSNTHVIDSFFFEQSRLRASRQSPSRCCR
jgi:integron integrase